MHLPSLWRSGALSLAVLASCSTAPPAAPASPELRVLFIGNSLTDANDLPGITAGLAAAAGVPAMQVGRVIRGGFSLEDHWNAGDAQRMIRSGGWDVIVLQQGPSALPESQANLLEFTRKFAALAASNDARVALYMVWPEASRETARDSVRDSYTNAAIAVGGILAPAGEAWREAWRHDATLPLYDSDGFHPSAMGSYLAALSLFQQLYGKSPVGLPGTGMDAGTVALLQTSAATADSQYGRR
jgi:hypothetical protein